MPAPLPIALLPFCASADARANAARIRAGIAAAAATGARVLLTPECGLTGYPSAAGPDLAGVDWCLVADLEDELALAAERHGIALVLGTTARTDAGCTNEAFVAGAVAPVRYRKQCLTPTDRRHFVAGSAAVTVDHDGWRLGVAICYDLRFVDVFARLAEAGADAFLVIAHMAGPDPDPGTKSALIPQLCATRAGEWATPLAFCNTAADDRYCDSAVWDARGMRVGTAATGLLSATLTHRDELDPWYAGLRREALSRWTATRG